MTDSMAQMTAMSWRAVFTRKLLYPGHTFPTAAAPVIVAIGLAWHDGVFAPLPALLAFVAGWLIQFAGVVTDNYENLKQQPEDREHPELVQAVKRGVVTLAGMRTLILVSYGLALLAGIYLVAVAGPPVLAIGLASIAASWLYSAGPWPFGRYGLADPVFFLFFGTVSVVGTYYVQAATVLGPSHWAAALPTTAVVLSLPIGALITDILIIDDIRDRDFDVVKGKNTIAVRYGRFYSRLEFVSLLVFAYLAPLWFCFATGYGFWSLLPLLSAPFAVLIARTIATHDDFPTLLPMTPRMAQLVVGYGVLLAVGLVLARA